MIAILTYQTLSTVCSQIFLFKMFNINTLTILIIRVSNQAC